MLHIGALNRRWQKQTWILKVGRFFFLEILEIPNRKMKFFMTERQNIDKKGETLLG